MCNKQRKDALGTSAFSHKTEAFFFFFEHVAVCQKEMCFPYQGSLKMHFNVTGANVLFYHRLVGSLPPSGLLFTVGL